MTDYSPLLNQLKTKAQQTLMHVQNLIPDEQTKAEIQQSVQWMIAHQLRQLNLVTREEFDIQCQLLANAHEKIRALEAEVDALRNQSKQPR